MATCQSLKHATARNSFRTLQSPPTVVGKIKSCPSDFIVEETLAFEPTGSGEHLYVELEKTGANTGWVAHRLATCLGLDDIDVSFAGRKDRHAVTRQWFSCYLPGRDDVDLSGFNEEGVKILGQTRHKAKLRRGQISHNSFRLIVRHDELTISQRRDIEERLAFVRDHGFPNYFGPQRFGRDGANLEQADRLLRFREKTTGSRGMLISAARSFLFNEYLADQLEAGEDLAGQQGQLIGKSRDPQPGEESFDDVERAWAEGLRRLGAKVAERELMVRPARVDWQFHDGHLETGFQLPAGSYATSMLGEIFLLEDASL